MESTNKWVGIFNEKFLEFNKDLIHLFPDDKDFKLCKQSFSLLQMVDEKKPVEMFRMYALKYQEKIINREEDFFLKHDFKEELESNGESNFSIDILIKIKNYWKNLSGSNKDIVWSYFSILYKINEKIVI